MPYGFICGFPTRGGDLYGGNAYGRSAQGAASLQARASAKACAQWGAGRAGRELIPHPVCKGKYQPWRAGQRMYGCFRHHEIRKRRIARAGLRDGWESFEQWERPVPTREEEQRSR